MKLISKSLIVGGFVLLIAPVFALEGCASKSSAKATKGSGAKGEAAKTAGQTTGSTATSHVSTSVSKGADYEGVQCDADHEGTAWCDDEHTAIFCVGGEWHALDCASIGGDVCAETTDAHVVDCDALADVQ